MTNIEKADLIKGNEKLREWQNKIATKEDMESIPLLSIKDLEPEPEEIPIEQVSIGQVQY